MSYRGVFIDDTSSEGVYAKQLSSGSQNGVEFIYIPVSNLAELAATILDQKPDIVALDYRLDEDTNTISPREAFKAGALAQHLRDKAIDQPSIDFPIILLSAEDKINKSYKPDRTAHDLFDRFFSKETVNSHRAEVRAEVDDLCAGYSHIKSKWASKDRKLVDLLALPSDDADLVEIQELQTAYDEAAAPHLVAKIVLRDFIDRRGFLISDQDALAIMGIGRKNEQKVYDFLAQKNCQYTGVFGKAHRRWWRHKIDDVSTDLFGKSALSLTGSERAKIMIDKLQMDVESATSTWTKSPDEIFSFACSSCGRPTELKHSVGAFERILPKYAQRRRICWDCVQTGRFVEAGLKVDDVDARLASRVKNQARP